MQPQYLESSFIPNFLPIYKAYENKTWTFVWTINCRIMANHKPIYSPGIKPKCSMVQVQENTTDVTL